MKPAARIALLYAGIAGLASAVNLLCQALAVLAYQGPHAVPLSVLAGTAAGLPVKYSLEKRCIFAFRADNLVHDSRLFVMYAFLGVFTTAVFWGVEFAFHLAFGGDAMRIFGGGLGLALGSWIKYHLDKRFVFVRPAGSADARAA